MFKLLMRTICHGPDCLAFEKADERLAVMEQFIPYPFSLKLSFFSSDAKLKSKK